MTDQLKALNVAIVGSGPGCKAIMDMILAEKLSQLQMKLIGVAYRNPESVGHRFAKERGIYVTRDYRDLYKLKDLNMIIELTGHERVANEISRTKPDQIRVMDHVAARVFWDVFQIEEQRIADLRSAHEALRKSEQEKEAILNSILEVMLYQDTEHRIVWANKLASESTGLAPEELVGRYCYEVWQQRDKPCQGCPVVKTREIGQTEEAEITTPDGRVWFVRGYPVRDANGDIVGVVEVKLEITERRRAEAALRESEARLQLTLKTIRSGLFTVDLDRKITYWNKEAEEITGLKAEEAIGRDCLEAFDCEECKKGCGLLDDKTDKPIYEKECTIHVDGRDITISKNADILKDSEGNTIGGLESFIDTTERKQAEEALLTYHEKLQSLASKLSLAEERQRHHVAIEVHDRISQNLAFVKMKLGTLRASTSSSSLAGTMDEILKLVDETLQNTRALISELGSPILYELGFVPAVEWLTQQTQKQHGIVLAFEDDGQPKPLSEDVRVLLFQAVRELLVNIAKHAQTRTAKVSITRDADQVRVDVEDDGVGFDSAEIGSSVDTTGRFGLFSIRVRLEPLGGHMEVESKPGHGTRVTLMAPLKHNGGNNKEKVS